MSVTECEAGGQCYICECQCAVGGKCQPDEAMTSAKNKNNNKTVNIMCAQLILFTLLNNYNSNGYIITSDVYNHCFS